MLTLEAEYTLRSGVEFNEACDDIFTITPVPLSKIELNYGATGHCTSPPSWVAQDVSSVPLTDSSAQSCHDDAE